MQLTKLPNYLLVIFVSLSFLPISLLAQLPDQPNYNFERLGIKEGLSQVTVNTITRDHQGFMWFGTLTGLNRYDGHSFRKYLTDRTDSTSINADYILTMFEDSQNRLWIGTAGGFSLYNRAKDNFRNTQDIRLQNTYIIEEAPNNKLWIGGVRGFYLFNPETFEIEKTYLKGVYAKKFLMSRDKKLWIGTEDEGIYVLDQSGNQVDRFVHSDDPNSLPHNRIKALHLDEYGTIRVGTEGAGLFQYKPENKTFVHLNVPSDVIWDVETVGDKLWIGTPEHGVVVYSPMHDTFHSILNLPNNPRSISENHILSVYTDPEGNVWLGGFRKGINFFNAKTNIFNLVSQNRGGLEILPRNNSLGLLEDKEGNIWFGTDGGGLTIYNPRKGTTKTYAHDPKDPNSIGSDAVLSINQDRKGNYWIGTWAGGLQHFDPKTEVFTKYTHDPKDSTTLPSDNIWRILDDSEGNFWVAVHDMGFCKFDPKKGEVLETIKPVYNGIVMGAPFNFYEDSKKNVYICSWQGLMVYDLKTDSLTCYLASNEGKKNEATLRGNIVNGVVEDKKGRIWLATSNGLTLFDPTGKNSKHYGTEDGFAHAYLNGIVEDDNGYLWVCGKNNISRFDPENKVVINYSSDDLGFEGEFLVGSKLKLKNGMIMFGNADGVTYFDPTKAGKNNTKPPVVITKFELFNRSIFPHQEGAPLTKVIEETKTLVLDHTQSVFSFEFVALNYINSEKNQYKYRLKGFDKEWLDGSKRSATYTNLDAGTYVFQVIASNNHDVWNEEGHSLTITVLPPWWKTLTARVAFIILVIGSFFAFYRYRTIRLKRIQKELEVLVKKRTVQLEEKQLEVTRQNSELKETQHEIVMQNEELMQQQEKIVAQRNYIEEKNHQLSSQNEQLQFQHDQITSSVRYAQTIQSAVLPTKDMMRKLFKEHFVIFRPKDVVAGDFYWVEKVGEYTFAAVVDCTGHGVPGAFMSMIGAASLNYIIKEKGITDPAAILERLNIRIQEALRQKESNNTDGMDLCLLRTQVDNGVLKVVYAGAKRPLFYLEKGILKEVAGARKAIGGKQKAGRVFENQHIDLGAGVTIYLTTDGYMDQNDPQRNKYGKARFLDFLEDISEDVLQVQQQKLEESLDEHQQDAEQRDDITIMALRFDLKQTTSTDNQERPIHQLKVE